MRHLSTVLASIGLSMFGSACAFAQSRGPTTMRDLNTGAIFTIDPNHAELPTEWIDKDTGHRVVRLTKEDGSASLYFHQNAYTPDGKKVIFKSPTGLYTVELATRKIEQILAEPGWYALAATLADAESAGHDPAALLAEAAGRRELGTAESASDVLVWRLRRMADLPADASVMPERDAAAARGTGPATKPATRRSDRPHTPR